MSVRKWNGRLIAAQSVLALTIVGLTGGTTVANATPKSLRDCYDDSYSYSASDGSGRCPVGRYLKDAGSPCRETGGGSTIGARYPASPGAGQGMVLGEETGWQDRTSHAVGRGAGGSGGRADFSA
nr:hypothetical protein StreXyl84_00500 [Streptomyces sp. Xyl84]